MTSIIERVASTLRERGDRETTIRRLIHRGSVREVREALGTDFFDQITLDAINKRVAKGFGTWQPLWPFVAEKVTASDFRNINSIASSERPDLSFVEEKAEYLETPMRDRKVTYTVSKFGNVFSISMEAEINDELRIFGKTAAKFGRAAWRKVNRDVMNTRLFANPTVTFDDGSNTLFHATRNNTQAYGTGPTPETIADVLGRMMAQTYIAPISGGTTTEIMVTPVTLIVHPRDFYLAKQSIDSDVIVLGGGTTTPRGERNYVGDSIRNVIACPFGTTAGQFIAAADPNVVDIIEIAFLDGKDTPDVISEMPNSGFEFTHDARRTKCRMVFGSANTDFRGVFRAT